MIVFLNGHFVPEDQARVSVFDRGFLYGDGLFETMRVLNGVPFRWDQHLERLTRGAEFLRIALPYTREALRDFANELTERNKMPDALLRITVSRGIGPRGYSPKGAEQPSLVMSVHPAPVFDLQHPPRWRLVTSSVRLPAHDALAQFKTCNKLPQILARAEAEDAGADEALLLNTEGWVVEGASSNLFWLQEGKVATPPLASGILAGVTRATVIEVCKSLGLSSTERQISIEDLLRTEGVFVSLSSLGIAQAVSINGPALPISPVIDRIRQAYNELLQRETVNPKGIPPSSPGLRAASYPG
jgi:aminodeoxychorismate lyase